MNKVAFIVLVLFLVVSCENSKVDLPDTEGLISLNETDLYVKTMGAGEPLLIIHGGPGLNFDYFLPQFEELADDYQLIFYDQRVSGRSSADVSPDNVTIVEFVKDIDAIVGHFKLQQINILAHSWGSLPALEYTLRHSEKVNNLILSNPVSLNPEYAEEEQQKVAERMTDEYKSKSREIASSEAFQQGDLNAYEDLFRLNFSLSFYDKSKMNELNFNLYDGFLEKSRLLANFQGLENYNYYARLDSLRNPLLVVRGKHDLSIEEADQQIVEFTPNAELVVFEESGHFPFVEQKDLYFQTVREFLNQNE